jgi:hypothetical protein
MQPRTRPIVASELEMTFSADKQNVFIKKKTERPDSLASKGRPIRMIDRRDREKNSL